MSCHRVQVEYKLGRERVSQGWGREQEVYRAKGEVMGHEQGWLHSFKCLWWCRNTILSLEASVNTNCLWSHPPVVLALPWGLHLPFCLGSRPEIILWFHSSHREGEALGKTPKTYWLVKYFISVLYFELFLSAVYWASCHYFSVNLAILITFANFIEHVVV